MNDKQQLEILNTKRFGYVISAFFVVISNISLINKWPFTPLLFLITMYFLTGALWIPVLIKPFYNIFKKSLGKHSQDNSSDKSKDIFSEN
jgi:hypothetical protein